MSPRKSPFVARSAHEVGAGGEFGSSGAEIERDDQRAPALFVTADDCLRDLEPGGY